ncbi:uncharacterized protein LOC126817629 [Patella vulgata]|uniref:uncharacterized protein LOC126817629 n=1 Tax=Patella vulgata TaxID=6465 RepID=UPI0024A9EB20|nr:uncharacterized protein LOC126817629 [Patella vulgata]
MNSSIQVLLENSQSDSRSPIKSNLQICEEMKEKLVTATECIENGFGGSKEIIQEKEFREINEEGKVQSICLEDALIESPLFVTESMDIQSYTKTQLCNFDHIHSFAMPSLKTIKLLLRDTEEKFLLKKFWQQEKYHDEDACIRLQVPDVSNGKLNVYNAMMEMKTSIQITKETNLGAAELKLSWDPFPKNVCCTSTFDGDKLTLNPRKTSMIPVKSMEDYKEKNNVRQDTTDEDYLNTMQLLTSPIFCQGQYSENFDSTSKEALNTKVTSVGVHHPVAESNVCSTILQPLVTQIQPLYSGTSPQVQYSSLKNTCTVEKVLTTVRNSIAPVTIPPLIPNSSSQKLSSLVRHTSSSSSASTTSSLINTHSASLKVARTPLISTPALEPINTIVQLGDPITSTSQLLSPIEVPTNNSPSVSTCTLYTIPTSFTINTLENNIKPLAINENGNTKSIGNTVSKSISGTLPVKNSNTLPVLPEMFNPSFIPGTV